MLKGDSWILEKFQVNLYQYWACELKFAYLLFDWYFHQIIWSSTLLITLIILSQIFSRVLFDSRNIVINGFGGHETVLVPKNRSCLATQVRCKTQFFWFCEALRVSRMPRQHRCNHHLSWKIFFFHADLTWIEKINWGRNQERKWLFLL